MRDRNQIFRSIFRFIAEFNRPAMFSDVRHKEIIIGGQGARKWGDFGEWECIKWKICLNIGSAECLKLEAKIKTNKVSVARKRRFLIHFILA